MRLFFGVLNTDIDFASHLKYIGTQNITLNNQQTFYISTAQGIKKIIAMINDGIAISICSTTLIDESVGKFYIVLNGAYTGTINIFIVGFDFSM